MSSCAIPYELASPQSRIPFPFSESETPHLPSFGEKLKLEREKRKISLDQISSTTKIGTRMLQALEEEKFSQLPGGIFNKGFVRAYARAVGLDEDQAVADYLQASGDAPAANTELATRDTASRDSAARDEDSRISRLEAISDEPSRPLPWGLFAVILLAVALLLSLWSHRRREQERQDVRPVPAKATGQSAVHPSATCHSVRERLNDFGFAFHSACLFFIDHRKRKLAPT